MPTLLFTLSPAGVSQIHDILVCLAKFNEDVSLEATQSVLRISSLNTAKTAHASFVLLGNSFFEKYHFTLDPKGQTTSKSWACKLQSRALLAIFTRKPSHNKDNEAILERCEFELQASATEPECRLVFRLVCRLGVVKTYRLTYEAEEVLHASFDHSNSNNMWTVSAKTLHNVVEYFGPKTEQLDWFLQDEKVTFTSYTEKIQSGREILKQPMHTSVALEKGDFDQCVIDQGLHIGIVVKDFRAIVAHAETIEAKVTARYSRGNRPMQITYSHSGLTSEFTLMTRGSSTLPFKSNTAATPARDLSVRPVVRQEQPSRQVSTAPTTEQTTNMAPPEQRASLKRQLSNGEDMSTRTQTPPPPTASINPDSLFIPADEDEQQWDEPNYDDEGDTINWDTTTEPADPSMPVRRIRDSEPDSFVSEKRDKSSRTFEIAPTQRLSQVKGMFD